MDRFIYFHILSTLQMIFLISIATGMKIIKGVIIIVLKNQYQKIPIKFKTIKDMKACCMCKIIAQ